jgi:hypothetical protein
VGIRWGHGGETEAERWGYGAIEEALKCAILAHNLLLVANVNQQSLRDWPQSD